MLAADLVYLIKNDISLNTAKKKVLKVQQQKKLIDLLIKTTEDIKW